jgi:tetratricopeptide (TPR) repeat protein
MSLDRSLIVVCAALLQCFRAAAQNPPAEVQAKIVPLFQSARQAEQRQDFSQAAHLYDQILTLDPKLAEVWANKGLVLYELDRHREALAAFARAAALKPDLITPQLFLGIEYVRLAEPQKAIAPLEAVLAREPANQQALYALAEANEHLERFRPAVNFYRELIRRDPGMEQVPYRLGITYLNWSRVTARKLIEVQPRSGWGDLLLADFEAVAGFSEDAERNYRAAVRALPGAVEPRIALARFYLESNPPAAEEQFARAGELASAASRDLLAQAGRALVKRDVVEATMLAGAAWNAIRHEHTPEVLHELDRRARQDQQALYRLSLTLSELARQTFEEAVRKNPNSYRAHMLLADLAKVSRDAGEARTEYARAVELAPENPDVRVTYIQFLEGEHDDAVTLGAAREAAAKFPTHPVVNTELGKMLLRSNQAREAAACFKRALEADATLAAARAGLADCHAAMGELEKAAVEMQRALPSDIDGSLHYRLGRWYQRLGREREAAEAYSQTARLKDEKRKSELMRFTLTLEK